jgi:hypothetical protein
MTTPSQGLRALASLMEAVAPQLSTAAQTALTDVTTQLHAAADAEATSEAARLAGPVAGPVLSAFATAMVDGFFSALHLTPAAAPSPAVAG